MFSDNMKISARQVQRLIVLDWIAKAGLLMPRFAAGASGRSFILSLVGGIVLSLLYAWMVGKLSEQVEGSFYDYIKERLGQGCAWLLSLLYICYAFVNTVFLVRLFAAVAVTFVMPETSLEVLMGSVLIGSMYIVYGGLAVKARVGEILFGVVLYPLLFMLLCAVLSVDSNYLAPGRAEISLQTLKHSLQMFIVFGGMGIFLFLSPSLNKRKAMKSILYRAVMLTAGGAFVTFLAAIGAFGESGMRALPWPAIILMSSAEVPGGFLQRWDVVFTSLLLAGFFVSVSTGLFYMKFLAGQVLGMERKLFIPVSALLVFAAAVWCGSYETAASVYVIINGYLLVPLLVLFTLLLLMVEYVKGRRKS